MKKIILAMVLCITGFVALRAQKPAACCCPMPPIQG